MLEDLRSQLSLNTDLLGHLERESLQLRHPDSPQLREPPMPAASCCPDSMRLSNGYDGIAIIGFPSVPKPAHRIVRSASCFAKTKTSS